MKIREKFVIYIIFVLFFVIYLFSANYLFNILIKIDNEASLVNITLPAETQDVKFTIEALRSWKLKWKDALFMQGWVFKINVKKGKRNVYLVLKSKNSTLIFEIEKDNLIRQDVTNVFHMEGDNNNHGFEIIIPLYRLKEDAYQIGFVIEDETGKSYYNSNKTLNISDKSVFLGDYEPEFISDQVSLCLNKSSNEITYYFDRVNKSEKYLTIQGWGFLKGMDAESLKIYILLMKNKNVAVFDAGVEIRKDVTNAFSKYSLNLDSSGFLSQISMEYLEKGNYQLGAPSGFSVGFFVDSYILRA